MREEGGYMLGDLGLFSDDVRWSLLLLWVLLCLLVGCEGGRGRGKGVLSTLLLVMVGVSLCCCCDGFWLSVWWVFCILVGGEINYRILLRGCVYLVEADW